MASFTFEAVDGKGNKVKKDVDASDRDDAMAKIKGMGLFPTKVKEKEAAPAAAAAAPGAKKKGKVLAIGGVSMRQLTTFTQQLATLQDAGLPIVRSIRILEGQLKPSLLKNTLMDVAEDTFDAMLGVNVRSGFLLARALARRMIAGGIRGRMLVVTSLHAETPRNLPHYSASKAGQTMLVKELARALGPHGIRINAIAPGAIPGGGFNASAFSFDGKIPLGRLGRAEDLAGPAVALLSDRFSGYVTGTTLVVDGGIALHNWITPATA